MSRLRKTPRSFAATKSGSSRAVSRATEPSVSMAFTWLSSAETLMEMFTRGMGPWLSLSSSGSDFQAGAACASVLMRSR